LIATAVRIAKALRLHLNATTNTKGGSEFFNQQVKKRLWLTICLLDLQTSLAHASKPLITVEEVKPSLDLIRHINDADFGPDTVNPVPDREGITDITFALIKFHLQVFGRQIGDGNTLPSQAVGLRLDCETVHDHEQHFERSVLRFLQFCDPESSPYSWFVWHSTHLYVAGARLSVLRPLYRAKYTGQVVPPRVRYETEIMEQTISALEKMRLMHTDPRAKDFRWMVLTQWHILAVAIAECYVCPNQALVRHAWSLIEPLYQKHESFMTRNSGRALEGPLGRLMRRTREKLETSLNGGPVNISGTSIQHASGPAVATTLASCNLGAGEATKFSPTGTLPMQEVTCAIKSPLHEEQLMTTSMSGIALGGDTWDQSWKMWDEFMCDVSFDDLNSPDTFF
jgi:hypothetical protein